MSSWRLDSENTIELRRLVSADIQAVVDLARRAFGSEEIAGKIETMLSLYITSGAGDRRFSQQKTMLSVVYYVMTQQQSRVEYLLGLTGLYYPLWAGEGVFWLGWFAIDPQFQGRGFGMLLLRATISLAAARNGRMLCVETSNDLDAALKLYRRAGFQRSGEIPDYWAPGSNLLILSRALDDIPILQEIPNDL